MSATRLADKTLVFCTAYVHSNLANTGYVPSIESGTAFNPAADGEDKFYTWDVRYRLWLTALEQSQIRYDQLLIVDDGSAVLPDWPDVTILQEGFDIACRSEKVLYHFKTNLGRRAVSDFPGWVRSFQFAGRYARCNGFTRIIHIESDAFLIGRRLQNYANRFSEGWVALWSERHNRPESGIQFIAGSGLQTYFAVCERHYDEYKNVEIETSLPFTGIEHGFIGDRYGEMSHFIPRRAEWCMQARPTGTIPAENYYWWLKEIPDMSEIMDRSEPVAMAVSPADVACHGVSHLDFLWWMNQLLNPRNYLEIGTHTGHSVERITCDAVCVDPHFQIHHNIINGRRNTHFFQGTSDDFFLESDVKRLFPVGIDMAFLDGLHLFEALLMDFINVERYSNERTVVVIHDCLPLNVRMAERDRRYGGEDEDASIRDWWTGDVWKILPILKKFRPDLTVSLVDSHPTGLVICTGLDAKNDSLYRNYDAIVHETAQVVLTLEGIPDIRATFPMYSSNQLIRSAYTMERAFRRVA
jgi:hypothetical protein